MPKKITQNARKSTDNPVYAEQQRLKEAENEIYRKQQEIEQLLKAAPAKIKKRRETDRNFVRLNVSAPAAPAIPRAVLRDVHGGDGRAQSPRRRPRRNERLMDKVQFLVLCLILATIGFLIWRSIP